MDLLDHGFTHLKTLIIQTLLITDLKLLHLITANSWGYKLCFFHVTKFTVNIFSLLIIVHNKKLKEPASSLDNSFRNWDIFISNMELYWAHTCPFFIANGNIIPFRINPLSKIAKIIKKKKITNYMILIEKCTNKGMAHLLTV